MYEKVLWISSVPNVEIWYTWTKKGLFGSVSLDIIDVTRPEMLEGIQGPLAQLWRGVFNGMRWCLWHGDSTTLRMPTSGSQGHRGNCCRNFCSFTINISSLKCPVWVWTNVVNLFEAALLSFVWPLVLVKFNHMCFVFKILKFLRSDDFYTKNWLFPYGLSPNVSHIWCFRFSSCFFLANRTALHLLLDLRRRGPLQSSHPENSPPFFCLDWSVFRTPN